MRSCFQTARPSSEKRPFRFSPRVQHGREWGESKSAITIGDLIILNCYYECSRVTPDKSDNQTSPVSALMRHLPGNLRERLIATFVPDRWCQVAPQQHRTSGSESNLRSDTDLRQIKAR